MYNLSYQSFAEGCLVSRQTYTLKLRKSLKIQFSSFLFKIYIKLQLIEPSFNPNKFYTNWVSKAQVMSSSIGLPCFYPNRVKVNFKELLKEIHSWSNSKIFMHDLLCISFLIKLFALNLKLYRASYALHITLWSKQRVKSSSQLVKITTNSF